MFRGWLQLGQTEIANTSRCVQYMLSGVRNGTAEVVTDDGWDGLWMWRGREKNYVSPWEDADCPWYDPRDSASAEFAGVWVMSVDAVDAAPLEREVVKAARVGGGFGVTRTPPRAMKVEALVIGGTPAGLEYGLGWLAGALRQDTCGDVEQPRQLLFLQSAPKFDESESLNNVNALGNAESRMMAQVACTSPLEVTERFGVWSPENRQATMARVEFELTAAVPWVWSLPTRLVSNLQPYYGRNDTVRFENTGADGSCPSVCQDTGGVLVDPEHPPLAVIPRAVTPAVTAGCKPLESRRFTWKLEAGRLPQWGEAVPTVTFRTGRSEERNVRVQWVEGEPTTEQGIACASVGEAMIGYIPAGARLTLDAITGLATVVTADGQSLGASHLVTGRFGGPWRQPTLRCGRGYTMIIDVEQTVASDFYVDVDAVVRRS